MLLQLPVELLVKISELLSHGSQKNLRLVCKSLNDATIELVFATFVIKVTDDALLSHCAMLKELATRTTDIWRYVKVLRLTQTTTLESVLANANVPQKSAKGVAPTLHKAISSFENVTAVDWNSLKSVDDAVIVALISSICRLPSLHKFTLYMATRIRGPLPTFHLKNLTSLDLSFSGPSWDDFICNSLPSILDNSPDLSFLSLGDETIGCAGTVNTLFQSLRRPLRLKSLALHMIFVPPPSILAPHCQFLTSFGVAPAGMLPPNFWSGLQRSNIHLRSLTIDDVNAQLLDYLMSYTGVEEIRLQVPTDDAEYDELGIKFYSEVIPHHSATFRILSIRPKYEGIWSFQESMMSPILQCRNLVSLWLSLRFSDISDPIESGVVAYLLCSIKSLPKIYLLSLECPLSFPPRLPPSVTQNRWKAKHMIAQAIEAVNTIPNHDPYLALQISIEPFGCRYRAHWDAESGFSFFYAETRDTDVVYLG
ncbi:uncharacterized protein EV420DRAFT_1634774 [Desarmillaria tabescens]|uniref:F-box domain-containing protein n=1 Tax=Armillaria tabescens TaxID=1929756 RepID=A0AA39NR63_ARMTA|nr:uncharacterized protein EV420DRAFT_1634774 [Desarmillaria tabescens]KAK0470349.1 hypothetical protein EV420DRAFT_1634774 [Desarmillaria tabescens]